jgi:hypothetical protein
MDLTINSLISAVIGGAVVALVNFLLRKRERQYFEEVEYRRKSYTDLLNNVRGFLNDPNVSEEEKRNMKKDFIKKYYNEVWLYASPMVIKKMNKFFQSITITKANPDDKTKALGETMLAIRKSLGNKNDDFIFFNRLKSEDYKLYSST